MNTQEFKTFAYEMTHKLWSKLSIERQMEVATMFAETKALLEQSRILINR